MVTIHWHSTWQTSRVSSSDLTRSLCHIAGGAAGRALGAWHDEIIVTKHHATYNVLHSAQKRAALYDSVRPLGSKYTSKVLNRADSDHQACISSGVMTRKLCFRSRAYYPSFRVAIAMRGHALIACNHSCVAEDKHALFISLL